MNYRTQELLNACVGCLGGWEWGVGAGCPTNDNFNCLWQMDVFLKCVKPMQCSYEACFLDTCLTHLLKHNKWTWSQIGLWLQLFWCSFRHSLIWNLAVHTYWKVYIVYRLQPEIHETEVFMAAPNGQVLSQSLYIFNTSPCKPACIPLPVLSHLKLRFQKKRELFECNALAVFENL